MRTLLCEHNNTSETNERSAPAPPPASPSTSTQRASFTTTSDPQRRIPIPTAVSMSFRRSSCDLQVLVAGTTYFAIVFSAAFVLGTTRSIALRTGTVKSELIAVIIELPIVLSISWKISAWVVCNQHISLGCFDRSIMGLVAFSLLMSAEFLLATQAFDKTPADFLNELISSTPQIVGLSGQILFAFFPLIQMFVGRNSSSSQMKKTRAQ